MGLLANARDYARFAVGRLNATVEMSNTDIDNILLPMVINTFSSIAPKVGEYDLVVQPNQTYYPLPHADIFAVDIASSPNSDTAGNLLGTGFSHPSFGQQNLQYTSWEAAAYAQEHAERVDVQTVQVVADKLEILPTPTNARTLKIKAKILWSFADEAAYDTSIPRYLHTCFKLVMTHHVAKAVYPEQAKYPTLRVGASNVQVNWQAVEALAERALKEARAEVSSSAALLIIQG